MRACTCLKPSLQGSPGDAGNTGGASPLVPVLVSVVVLVDASTYDLAGTLATAAALLASLGIELELIVVASGVGDGDDPLFGIEAALPETRAYLLTQDVDRYTAAWRGIENARGDRVLVIDPATDDIHYMPELLRRAAAGADIVFARNESWAPRRLSVAIACRLRDAIHQSLGVTSVEDEAPCYRVLSRHVVSFIARHPDPVDAYRRLPSGSSFTRAHLRYSASATLPRAPKRERAKREARRLASTALATLTALRGHDTTFHDPRGGDETTCLLKIPALHSGTFVFDEQLLRQGTSTYYAMNPTLVRLGQNTWVNVRLVNYLKQGHGAKLVDGRVFRSRNLVFEWNTEARVMGAAREQSGVPAAWAQGTRVRGLEDQRWVVHEGRLWFSACCSQVPQEEGRASMVLGRLNETLDGVDHLVPLRFDAARDAEKNWLLWSIDGQLLCIYGYHPFTLLSLDTETGRARTFRVHRAELPARRLRGSAGPVPVAERPGHWLVLAHEVARRFEKPVYAHRWLLVHPEAGLVAHSRPFVFDHVGIEYAAGLLDNGDGTLTVTYGFEDRQARWVVIDRASVLASLYEARQVTGAVEPEAEAEAEAEAAPESTASIESTRQLATG